MSRQILDDWIIRDIIKAIAHFRKIWIMNSQAVCEMTPRPLSMERCQKKFQEMFASYDSKRDISHIFGNMCEVISICKKYCVYALGYIRWDNRAWYFFSSNFHL